MLTRAVRPLLLFGASVWCSAIVAAPLLQWPLLYQFFSLTCHQLPGRSWHLGDEPFGVCIRCSSIAFGFLFGLLFLRKPRARWFTWALALTTVQWSLAAILVDSEVLRVVTAILLGGSAAPIVTAGVEEMFAERIKAVHESM